MLACYFSSRLSEEGTFRSFCVDRDKSLRDVLLATFALWYVASLRCCDDSDLRLFRQVSHLSNGKNRASGHDLFRADASAR